MKHSPEITKFILESVCNERVVKVRECNMYGEKVCPKQCDYSLRRQDDEIVAKNRERYSGRRGT